MSGPLDPVSSIKVKLGLLVAASVVVAVLLSLLGSAAGVPALLVLPVSVLLALGVTQLLAAGMVQPLRQMTDIAQQMARGDYTGRVVATSNDEVGRLATAFNKMAEDLATVDAERRDLIATVSHELRTPLTAMTALLENLADGVVPADEQRLGEALEQAERLRSLVTDLLELSRLEAGVARLENRPVRLRRLVEECVAQVVTAGRTGPFLVEVPEGMQVQGDAARLRQLVVNALDNAGRHTAAGEPVLVAAGSSAESWWLHVVDTGPGVAPVDRERVFDRFGTDKPGGGTGLGLAIARWVAQLHGGTLRFVDPPSGRGAVLRLDVPLTRPDQETAMPPPPTSSKTPAAVPASSTPSGTRAPAPAVPPSRDEAPFSRYWPEPTGAASLRAVAASALAGVLGGTLLSFTEPGITWTLVLVVSGAAALATAKRRRERWTLLCAGLALLLVLPTTLLAASWVGALGSLLAAAVFLSGVTAARSVQGIVLTGLSWPLSSVRGLPWFGRSLRVAGTGGRTPAIVRTVAWSLLALAVFGAIFASADALFASWVDVLVPSVSFGHLVGRGFVAVAVFGLTLAAAYLAWNPPRVELWSHRRPVPLTNRFEWLVPVLVVDLVFIGFLAAQAAAVFGGHAYVESTTGLTYADYVHQGFGQLTLATVLTLFVVWAASRRAGSGAPDQWWLRGSLGLLCALTLVVVASALYRMHVYQQAYGFTTLRVFVDVFEGWLGFVVLAVMVLGVTGLARWLPRVALVSAAVALLGLAAINPDAWVAGRNIDRWEETGRLDLYYLSSLSPDAAPVILDRLPKDVARCVLDDATTYGSLRTEVLDDPRAWNWGRSRGKDALDKAFPDPSSRQGPCMVVLKEFGRDVTGGVG